MKHATEHLLELLSQVKQRQFVLFLDYDGTLSPIVERPEWALMPEDARTAVQECGNKFITAIISGRAKKNVFELVKIPELFYAGSHGFDIEGPQLPETSSSPAKMYPSIRYEAAAEYVPILAQVAQILHDKLKHIDGCIVENNKFALTVHYRMVKEEEDIKYIFNTVEETVQKSELFKKGTRVTEGKKVIEIRANFDWHKGKAILHLLQALKLDEPEKVFSVFIGDDKTDEDGFKALKEHNLGIGILVTEHPETDERITKNQTAASYYLKNPKEVANFLAKLAKL